MKQKRLKLRLMPKFILSLGILGLVMTVAIAYFSYNNSKTYLEEMYAQRVTTGSKSVAHMLSVDDVKTVVGQDGENSAAYEEMVKLFNTLKKDGEITYLSLVRPDEDSVIFYIDAFVEEMGDDPANVIPYGSDIFYSDAASGPDDLQRYLIAWELYQANQGTDTPLITDNDYGYNYTSVSPVLDEDGNAIAEVQYILDMQQVRDHLNGFLTAMLLVALAVIAAALLSYIVFVRYAVTRPVGTLAKFTNDITASGDFENGRSISLTTGDEIEDLGNSFNYMLSALKSYIENLSRVTAEKERIGAELSVATEIQASMLPSIFPPFPDRPEFNLFALMHPAKEVGGDFYDFFLVDDNHLALVIADVSGKGVPAALFMMISMTHIRNAVRSGLSPKEALEKVNNLLCENNEAEMFVTVWLGVLDISTGVMRCANAGHEYPALRRANGVFELVRDKHGFVVAGMENVRYREYTMELEPGDTLLVYTDGVPEATNADTELYGTDRMLEALNRCGGDDCHRLIGALRQDMDTFVGQAPQFDDITILCMNYLGGQAEQQ